MSTEQGLDSKESDRLRDIGAVFEGMGITTVELAAALRDHLSSCPGGKACIEKLIAGLREEGI